MTGKRYRSLIQDMEEDEQYGEVIHSAGSTFTVGDPLSGDEYAILWDQAIDKDGRAVPPAGCIGMWTIWSIGEIARDAVEIIDRGEGN